MWSVKNKKKTKTSANFFFPKCGNHKYHDINVQRKWDGGREGDRETAHKQAEIGWVFLRSVINVQIRILFLFFFFDKLVAKVLRLLWRWVYFASSCLWQAVVVMPTVLASCRVQLLPLVVIVVVKLFSLLLFLLPLDTKRKWNQNCWRRKQQQNKNKNKINNNNNNGSNNKHNLTNTVTEALE